MTKTLLALLSLLSASACIAVPAIGPPNDVEAIPACILTQWPTISQMAASEVQRIAVGDVAPLEHGLEEMNEGDVKMLYWVTVWGIVKRGRQEGTIQCDELANTWADLAFRRAGNSTNPRPSGHSLNALRRVTAGWGPLPLEMAAKPTEGDYHATLLYLGNVIDAYLDPAGPYYIGPNRWIPPSLSSVKKN